MTRTVRVTVSKLYVETVRLSGPTEDAILKQAQQSVALAHRHGRLELILQTVEPDIWLDVLPKEAEAAE